MAAKSTGGGTRKTEERTPDTTSTSYSSAEGKCPLRLPATSRSTPASRAISETPSSRNGESSSTTTTVSSDERKLATSLVGSGQTVPSFRIGGLTPRRAQASRA